MTIIKTISFGKEKEQVFLEFKKIAAREGKDTSKMLVSLMEEYVKQHSSGNPSFTIDQFQDPSFQAIPSYKANIDNWVNYYKESNEKDKTQLRMRALELSKKFRMVDINS